MRSTSLTRRPVYVVVAVMFVITALITALTSVLVGSATARPQPAPVRIQIDTITGMAAPSGVPTEAVPTTIVEASERRDVPAAEEIFTIQVSFWGADGQPASFPVNTRFTITSSQGKVRVLGVDILAGLTAGQLTATMTAPVNRVAVTVDDVAPRKKAAGVASDTSTAAQLFDVVGGIRVVPSQRGVDQTAGIGGEDGSCREATRAVPVCGVLMLPRGAVSSTILLSTGACDAVYTKCRTAPNAAPGAVVQVLADLDFETTSGVLQNLYTRTAPATIVVKCDYSLCRGGALKKLRLNYSLQGNDALVGVPDCPGKSTIGKAQDACTDYVQSKRKRADTWLYFLFFKDARVSMG